MLMMEQQLHQTMMEQQEQLDESESDARKKGDQDLYRSVAKKEVRGEITKIYLGDRTEEEEEEEIRSLIETVKHHTSTLMMRSNTIMMIGLILLGAALFAFSRKNHNHNRGNRSRRTRLRRPRDWDAL